MLIDYYSQPVRVAYRISSGRVVSRPGGYGLIRRMRDAGRLVGAWSTGTGRAIA